MHVCRGRDDQGRLNLIVKRNAIAVGDTAFGCPRAFVGGQYSYLVISPRARGLVIGVNMNPDKRCNFDCVYCEVNRVGASPQHRFEVGAMIEELDHTMAMMHSGEIGEFPFYRQLPRELLKLRHVTLSGDGEPTLNPNFLEAVQSIVQLRAQGRYPFFKLVLLTNATCLNDPEVLRGVQLFRSEDEIWAKLDAGSQASLDQVNRGAISIEAIQANILLVARRRPVIIQSLFAAIDGKPPSSTEIDCYIQRLVELTSAGAQIPLVQIYSDTRPMAASNCRHLPLRTLNQIAQCVKQGTGLCVEVF